MTSAVPAAFVDAHQHFWTDSPYSGGDYTPDDYLRDLGTLRSRLEMSVFVECNTNYDASLPRALRPVGETRFAAAIGAAHAASPPRLAAGIVACADPFADDVAFEAILDAQRDASAGRLRSIRRCVAWDAHEAFVYPILRTHAGMLAAPRMAEALRSLAARGLAFETWLYHPQLDELAALARAVPDCTIVLAHAGTPLASGPYAEWSNSWNDWRAGMARLATCANVHVKIGGLITHGSRLDSLRRERGLAAWTVEALAESLSPWLVHLLECFGAHCTLPVLVEAYARALPTLTADDRDAVFRTNALRLYDRAVR